MNFKEIACDKECRFETGGTRVTLLGWKPVYDKDGNQLNQDPNTKTTEIRCTVCYKIWQATERYGETSFTEVITK